MLVGLLKQCQCTIDLQVVEADVAPLTRQFVTLGHTVELAIFHVDVIHLAGIGHADHQYTVARLLAGYVLHPYVTYCGVESSAAYLARLIVGIDLQHGFLTLSNSDVAHVDVLDDAAATGVGFYAKHTVQ